MHKLIAIGLIALSLAACSSSSSVLPPIGPIPNPIPPRAPAQSYLRGQGFHQIILTSEPESGCLIPSADNVNFIGFKNGVGYRGTLCVGLPNSWKLVDVEEVQ